MVKMWAQTTPQQRAILKGLGGEQGVFVRPSFVRAMKGDGNAAIIMQHMLYWSQTDMAAERNGWFYLTSQRITKDTGLSYDVQERVRRKIIGLGVLEQERRGVPARNYYCVNLSRLADLLTEVEESLSTLMPSNKTGDAPVPEQEDHLIIEQTVVNTKEKTEEKNIVIPLIDRPGQKNAKENVLGTKLPKFVDWVVTNYPQNSVKIGATPTQATRIAVKLGTVTSHNSKEIAERNVKEFIRGIRNFKAKVDSGSYDSKYVPKFERWSGLRPQGNEEPPYIAWAAMTLVDDKPEFRV